MRATEATFRCRICRKIIKSKEWTLQCEQCNRQMVIVEGVYTS